MNIDRYWYTLRHQVGIRVRLATLCLHVAATARQQPQGKPQYFASTKRSAHSILRECVGGHRGALASLLRGDHPQFERARLVAVFCGDGNLEWKANEVAALRIKCPRKNFAVRAVTDFDAKLVGIARDSAIGVNFDHRLGAGHGAAKHRQSDYDWESHGHLQEAAQRVCTLTVR